MKLEEIIERIDEITSKLDANAQDIADALKTIRSLARGVEEGLLVEIALAKIIKLADDAERSLEKINGKR